MRQFLGSMIGATLLTSLLAAGQVHASAEVYQRTLRSTVWIMKGNGSGEFGTGVLVDRERRLVVTNNHVIEGASTAQVFFPRYRDGLLITEPEDYFAQAKTVGMTAKVLVRSPRKDLAVLELPRLPEEAEAISLAAASPSPGEMVHAIGNSGLNDGVLWRYRSGFVRQVYVHSEYGGTFQTRVVETENPDNHGDSGGPIVNDRAELVALTCLRDERERNRLVSWSVDIHEIKALLASRIEVEKMPEGTAPSLAGMWKTTDGEIGVRADVELRLGTNGTYLMKTTVFGVAQEVKGRYTYKDGNLTLMMIDGTALPGQVTRDGESKFAWTIEHEGQYAVRQFRRLK